MHVCVYMCVRACVRACLRKRLYVCVLMCAIIHAEMIRVEVTMRSCKTHCVYLRERAGMCVYRHSACACVCAYVCGRM